MQQPQKNNGQVPQNNPKKPIVVKIKPGISNAKSVKIILPEEMADKSIDQVINYILDNPGDRDAGRIADRVKGEMGKKYGITANSQPVTGKDKVADYFRDEKSKSGKEYKEIEIIVAAQQEGGLKKYLE